MWCICIYYFYFDTFDISIEVYFPHSVVGSYNLGYLRRNLCAVGYGQSSGSFIGGIYVVVIIIFYGWAKLDGVVEVFICICFEIMCFLYACNVNVL